MNEWIVNTTTTLQTGLALTATVEIIGTYDILTVLCVHYDIYTDVLQSFANWL